MIQFLRHNERDNSDHKPYIHTYIHINNKIREDAVEVLFLGSLSTLDRI